jgi:hypothetical protein
MFSQSSKKKEIQLDGGGQVKVSSFTSAIRFSVGVPDALHPFIDLSELEWPIFYSVTNKIGIVSCIKS